MYYSLLLNGILLDSLKINFLCKYIMNLDSSSVLQLAIINIPQNN